MIRYNVSVLQQGADFGLKSPEKTLQKRGIFYDINRLYTSCCTGLKTWVFRKDLRPKKSTFANLVKTGLRGGA
jgi:hypothetical protein